MKYVIYYTLFAFTLLMAQSRVPEEFNEGVKYMELGEYELAAKYFQDAINKNPKLAPAWFNLAVAYDITGQDSLAIICYQKAAKLDPEDPDPWIYLAQLYQRHDNPRLAINAYEKPYRVNQMMLNYLIHWQLPMIRLVGIKTVSYTHLTLPTKRIV